MNQNYLFLIVMLSACHAVFAMEEEDPVETINKSYTTAQKLENQARLQDALTTYKAIVAIELPAADPLLEDPSYTMARDLQNKAAIRIPDLEITLLINANKYDEALTQLNTFASKKQITDKQIQQLQKKINDKKLKWEQNQLKKLKELIDAGTYDQASLILKMLKDQKISQEATDQVVELEKQMEVAQEKERQEQEKLTQEEREKQAAEEARQREEVRQEAERQHKLKEAEQEAATGNYDEAYRILDMLRDEGYLAANTLKTELQKKAAAAEAERQRQAQEEQERREAEEARQKEEQQRQAQETERIRQEQEAEQQRLAQEERERQEQEARQREQQEQDRQRQQAETQRAQVEQEERERQQREAQETEQQRLAAEEQARQEQERQAQEAATRQREAQEEQERQKREEAEQQAARISRQIEQEQNLKNTLFNLTNTLKSIIEYFPSIQLPPEIPAKVTLLPPLERKPSRPGGRRPPSKEHQTPGKLFEEPKKTILEIVQEAIDKNEVEKNRNAIIKYLKGKGLYPANYPEEMNLLNELQVLWKPK